MRQFNAPESNPKKVKWNNNGNVRPIPARSNNSGAIKYFLWGFKRWLVPFVILYLSIAPFHTTWYWFYYWSRVLSIEVYGFAFFFIFHNIRYGLSVWVQWICIVHLFALISKYECLEHSRWTFSITMYTRYTRFGHFSHLFLFTNEPNPKVNKIQ